MSKNKIDKNACDHIVSLEVDRNEGYGDVTDCYVELVCQSQSNGPGHYGATDFKFCPMCGIKLKVFKYTIVDDNLSPHEYEYTKMVGENYVPREHEIPCENENNEGDSK